MGAEVLLVRRDKRGEVCTLLLIDGCKREEREGVDCGIAIGGIVDGMDVEEEVEEEEEDVWERLLGGCSRGVTA